MMKFEKVREGKLPPSEIQKQLGISETEMNQFNPYRTFSSTRPKTN